MKIYYGSEGYEEYLTGESLCVTDLKHLPAEYEALILFAQPDAAELREIQRRGVQNVFAHHGIRVDCRKFSHVEELKSLLASLEAQRDSAAIASYLKSLRFPTDEERAYLHRQYGIDLGAIACGDDGRPTDRQPLVKSSETAGRLLTFRGSEEAFRIFADLLKKYARRRRTLLVDCDLERPSFDSLFGIDNVMTAERSYLTGKDNTGLNIALELLQRKHSVDDIVQRTVRSRGNRHLLLGNYNVYNCEYYSIGALQALVSGMLQRFDIVVLKLSDSLYDELAMAMTHRSDFNMIVVDQKKSDIRYKHQLYEVLVRRQDISVNNIKVYRTSIKRHYLFGELFQGSYRGDLGHMAKEIKELAR